tara:strand:- start:3228 stop:3509 length:282 start_codon:yes stop_codon:yes gene_type:complete
MFNNYSPINIIIISFITQIFIILLILYYINYNKDNLEKKIENYLENNLEKKIENYFENKLDLNNIEKTIINKIENRITNKIGNIGGGIFGLIK